MANVTRRTAVMALAMTLGLAAGAAANDEPERTAPGAGDGPGATIVLRVENTCRIAQPVLSAAQETATSIYDAIGVRLVWLIGRVAPPPELADAVRFRVALVRETAEGPLLSAFPVHPNSRRHVMGVASIEARSAYLFCRRIAGLAHVSTIKAFDVALGRALAHEVGHLVLPHIVHSGTGIMRARLDLHRDQAPGFTDEQGESIRTLLMALK